MSCGQFLLHDLFVFVLFVGFVFSGCNIFRFYLLFFFCQAEREIGSIQQMYVCVGCSVKEFSYLCSFL